jgi:hypothetical protein
MKLIISCFCLLFTLTAYSQQKYSWDEYGISFTLADDFKEVDNTIDQFSADGDGMTLSILPFKDETVSDADITKYTIEIAKSMNLGTFEDVDLIDINSFKGAYVEGTKDGVKFFIMGLIDPESDTNFFVTIVFADKDEEATKEAINICKSIKKN